MIESILCRSEMTSKTRKHSSRMRANRAVTRSDRVTNKDEQ